MNKTEVKVAHDLIRANKLVATPYLINHGYLQDDLPETLQPLVDDGCIIRVVTAKRTAGSRQPPVKVMALARDEKIARCPDYMLVQILGLHAAKVALGLAPLDLRWVPAAEYNTQYQAGRSRFVIGIVPDGRWDEYGRDGLVTPWQLEYSHGEFEARRLREKIIALGPNPQIWITPSASHGRMIAKLLHEIYPGLERYRIVIVDWTGSAS
jgi:hypothetical protein